MGWPRCSRSRFNHGLQWLASAERSTCRDGDPRLAALMHASPVQAFEQRLQLRRGQSHDAVGNGGPLELAVFQPLREQADARPIEVNQLDPVGASRPEHIDRARERLCGAPHNRSYASGEIMWRSRPDACQGRPIAACLRHIIFRASLTSAGFPALWFRRGRMLEVYFSYRGVLKRLRSGALGGEMDRFERSVQTPAPDALQE